MNCAGCATGRRTFKLMTFNAKLHCVRRETSLERGLTHKMYPSENKKGKRNKVGGTRGGKERGAKRKREEQAALSNNNQRFSFQSATVPNSNIRGLI